MKARDLLGRRGRARRAKEEQGGKPVTKLFQKTLFGIIALFGVIGLSTSVLAVYTVDTHLSEEYLSNSRDIVKTIADSSVDILLNRDLASLQALIDQFLGIQGIKYVYITDENGEFLAHTFVPGIPDEILASDTLSTETVERNLPGMGDFVEVASPILAGVAGSVHVGMDTGLIALKIQRAIGRQVYLIVTIFVVGVFAALWFVKLAARPIGDVLAYAVTLADHRKDGDAEADGVLADGQPAPGSVLDRNDEAGQMARLLLYLARGRKLPEAPGA